MIGAIIDWAREQLERRRFAQSVGDANRDTFITQEEIMASLNNGRADAIDSVFSRVAYTRLREWYIDTRVNQMYEAAEGGRPQRAADAILVVQAQQDESTRRGLEIAYLNFIRGDVQQHIDVARGLSERELAELRDIARTVVINPTIADTRRIETARGMLGMHNLSGNAVNIHDIDELADRLLNDADRRELDAIAARQFNASNLEERRRGLIA